MAAAGVRHCPVLSSSRLPALQTAAGWPHPSGRQAPWAWPSSSAVGGRRQHRRRGRRRVGQAGGCSTALANARTRLLVLGRHGWRAAELRNQQQTTAGAHQFCPCSRPAGPFIWLSGSYHQFRLGAPMFNTEPGPNRWRAVQEPPRRTAASSRPPPDGHEVQRSTAGRPRQGGSVGEGLDGGRFFLGCCRALCSPI